MANDEDEAANDDDTDIQAQQIKQLELLKSSIESILNDIDTKGQKIQEYGDNQLKMEASV